MTNIAYKYFSVFPLKITKTHSLSTVPTFLFTTQLLITARIIAGDGPAE